MFLTSPEEVRKYIGATFESALSQPDVADGLARHPMRLRFGVVDPDCVLYIDTERKEVRFGSPGDVPASAMVAMDGDTAVLLCQGRLDVASAMASGSIAAEGEIAILLDLLSSRAGLSDIYTQVLLREGRSDLLAS
jgi:hypothetical protein